MIRLETPRCIGASLQPEDAVFVSTIHPDYLRYASVDVEAPRFVGASRYA